MHLHFVTCTLIVIYVFGTRGNGMLRFHAHSLKRSKGSTTAILPIAGWLPHACMQSKSKVWAALVAALIPLVVTLSPLSKLPFIIT